MGAGGRVPPLAAVAALVVALLAGCGAARSVSPEFEVLVFTKTAE